MTSIKTDYIRIQVQVTPFGMDIVDIYHPFPPLVGEQPMPQQETSVKYIAPAILCYDFLETSYPNVYSGADPDKCVYVIFKDFNTFEYIYPPQLITVEWSGGSYQYYGVDNTFTANGKTIEIKVLPAIGHSASPSWSHSFTDLESVTTPEGAYQIPPLPGVTEFETTGSQSLISEVRYDSVLEIQTSFDIETWSHYTWNGVDWVEDNWTRTETGTNTAFDAQNNKVYLHSDYTPSDYNIFTTNSAYVYGYTQESIDGTQHYPGTDYIPGISVGKIMIHIDSLAGKPAYNNEIIAFTSSSHIAEDSIISVLHKFRVINSGQFYYYNEYPEFVMSYYWRDKKVTSPYTIYSGCSTKYLGVIDGIEISSQEYPPVSLTSLTPNTHILRDGSGNAVNFEDNGKTYYAIGEVVMVEVTETVE